MIWSPQPRQAAFMARTEDEALYGALPEAVRATPSSSRHCGRYTSRTTGRSSCERLTRSFRSSSTRPCGTTSRCFPKRGTTARATAGPSQRAKIYFGSLNHTQDKYNYQGKAFDFIGVDELTHFTWDEYSYVMSRNRPSGPGTRVYIRATANPAA